MSGSKAGSFERDTVSGGPRQSPAGREAGRQEPATLEFLLRWCLSFFTLGLYALLAPWGYALFALMVMAPTRDRVRRRSRLQRAIQVGFACARGWLRLLRIVDIRTPDPREVALPAPCVLVANHPTHMDILAIFSWARSACTIVKPSIYRRWWLEPLMRGSGQIEGAGGHPLDAARLVERSVDRLRDGLTVVVFPEGTRTEEGREMPFHRLAFEIACRSGVPVVPLRIACDPPYLSKTRSVFRPPRTAPVLSVVALAPLRPEDFGNDSRSLRDHVRSLYSGDVGRR